MKILVTGPTGFIGRNLINKLLKSKHQIIAIEKEGADISFLEKNKIRFGYYDKTYSSVYHFVSQEKPDGIIHLASLFLAAHKAENIEDLVNSNVLFPLHLIEAASNANVRWFLNTGTFWQNFQNKDFSPVNLYAASKQSFQDLAKYYFEAKNINFSTLKLSDTFGPGDSRPKVFNLWLNAAKTGETLEMSPGEQLIDISFIDNVVDGFFTLAEILEKDENREYCGKVYALKAEKRYTLKELSEVFRNITQSDLKINWGKKPYRFREVMIPWETGESIPGWKPKISLEDGIRIFYNNYIMN